MLAFAVAPELDFNAIANNDLAISEPGQVILRQPEVMADLVQYRYSDLPDKVFAGPRDHLNRLLKNVNHIVNDPGVFHAALRARSPNVKTEQQAVRPRADAAKLRLIRPVEHLNGNLLEKSGELLRKLRDRLLDELPELRFAHLIRHR
jgi:hypothetical protein